MPKRRDDDQDRKRQELALKAVLARLEAELVELAQRITRDQARRQEIRRQMAAIRQAATDLDGGAAARVEATADTGAYTEPGGRPGSGEPTASGRRVAVYVPKSLVDSLADPRATLRAGEMLRSMSDGLREQSVTSMARDVLRARGAPMHADEILRELALDGTDVKKDTLVVALARLARAGRVFYRVKGEPNTFGLQDWVKGKLGGRKR